MTMHRLKRKLQEYYNEERKKGKDEVTAKYNATQAILFYVLGLIEHYCEWEDIEAIKSITKQYQYLELLTYDHQSTDLFEQAYRQSS